MPCCGRWLPRRRNHFLLDFTKGRTNCASKVIGGHNTLPCQPGKSQVRRIGTSWSGLRESLLPGDVTRSVQTPHQVKIGLSNIDTDRLHLHSDDPFLLESSPRFSPFRFGSIAAWHRIRKDASAERIRNRKRDSRTRGEAWRACGVMDWVRLR